MAFSAYTRIRRTPSKKGKQFKNLFTVQILSLFYNFVKCARDLVFRDIFSISARRIVPVRHFLLLRVFPKTPSHKTLSSIKRAGAMCLFFIATVESTEPLPPSPPPPSKLRRSRTDAPRNRRVRNKFPAVSRIRNYTRIRSRGERWNGKGGSWRGGRGGERRPFNLRRCRNHGRDLRASRTGDEMVERIDIGFGLGFKELLVCFWNGFRFR